VSSDDEELRTHRKKVTNSSTRRESSKNRKCKKVKQLSRDERKSSRPPAATTTSASTDKPTRRSTKHSGRKRTSSLSSETSDDEVDLDRSGQSKNKRGVSKEKTQQKSSRHLTNDAAKHAKNNRRHDSTDTSCSSSSSQDDDDDDNDDEYNRRSKSNKKNVPPKSQTAKTSSSVSNQKRDIKPNKFSGKGCVETFLAQFQICAEHNGWSETEKASQLKCCVVDEAGSLVWDSGKPGDVTYNDLVEKLRRRYGFLDQQEKFEAELRARRQGDKETLAELYQEIRCTMLKAYPGESSSSLYERTAKEFFLGAMKDRKMASKIREREPKDLETAFKQALRLEAHRKADENSVA